MSESGILIEPSSKIKGVRTGEGSGAFFSMDFEGILREDTDNIIDRALKEDRSFLMEHECKEKDKRLKEYIKKQDLPPDLEELKNENLTNSEIAPEKSS